MGQLLEIFGLHAEAGHFLDAHTKRPGSGKTLLGRGRLVVDDEIVVRPMMYVALSYDHRIVDGREAVTFLKRIKEFVENPERIIMEI